MKKPFTIECAYATYMAAVVTVEADTLEEAIPLAVQYADDNERWKSADHATDPHVNAACQGADGNPWDGAHSALPMPVRFTERGEPPVVTLSDPGRPGSGIEVSGGRVLTRFKTDTGTVTAEMCDPPIPPMNKPLVTVTLGPDGKPHVRVENGKARVRLLDA